MARYNPLPANVVYLDTIVLDTLPTTRARLLRKHIDNMNLGARLMTEASTRSSRISFIKCKNTFLYY